jgi:hypothetical protein
LALTGPSSELLAAQEKDPKLKADFEKQAAAYRKLAEWGRLKVSVYDAPPLPEARRIAANLSPSCRSWWRIKKAPTQTPGPSDYRQKITLKTFASDFWLPDYCALIPVVPVMMVMIVGMISVVMPVVIVAVVMPVIVAIVVVVTMVIAVPSCGWSRAAGYNCADNA